MTLASLRTDKSSHQTRLDLKRTFYKWGVSQWDAPSSARIGGQDATVRFVLRGESKVMTCSHFPSYEQNLRALYLAIEGLRLADQRHILEQYRQFFQALPPPNGAMPTQHDPYRVLNVTPSASLEVCEAAYRALSKAAHPDRGGDDRKMRELNAAIEAIRQARAGARS